MEEVHQSIGQGFIKIFNRAFEVKKLVKIVIKISSSFRFEMLDDELEVSGVPGSQSVAERSAAG